MTGVKRSKEEVATKRVVVCGTGTTEGCRKLLEARKMEETGFTLSLRKGPTLLVNTNRHGLRRLNSGNSENVWSASTFGEFLPAARGCGYGQCS